MKDATEIMKDRTAVKILLSTYRRPMTAKEISDSTGIPLVEVYKKIKELEKLQLMQKEGGIITRRGRAKPVYRANIEDAYVFFDNGRLKARFEVAAGMARAFEERYRAEYSRR